MKTPAELASRLRKMVLAAQHHYSPQGEPLRSIVVSPEWLEDMADAANALDATPVAQVCVYPDCNCPFDAPSDPDWCARGLPHAATVARGCGIIKV